MADSFSRKLIRNSTAEFLIFTAQEGDQSIEARYEDETIWLSQRLMAELFDVGVPTINHHLQSIFETSELDRDSVIRTFRITAADGKRYQTQHYNLDAIISVGYRVNSVRATQFRQWATSVLRDFAIRGYVLDRKRLENGAFLGEDYFERLLDEIREIRLSERRFYQKVTDIYATSVDYNPDAPTTRQFFASVLHSAISHHNEQHDWTSRLMNSLLDLAEDRGQRRIPMTMEAWVGQFSAFPVIAESAFVGPSDSKSEANDGRGSAPEMRVNQPKGRSPFRY